MHKFDTHMAVYEHNIRELTKYEFEKVGEVLGKDCPYATVFGGTCGPVRRLYTFETQDRDAANRWHNKLFSLGLSMSAPVLVETEKTLDLVRLVEGVREKGGVELKKVMKARRDYSREHWGDVHLDVPLCQSKIKAFEKLVELGYEYLAFSSGWREEAYASFTVQFERKEDFVECVEQLATVGLEYDLELSSETFYGERLLRLDCINGANPLPICIGFDRIR